MNVEEQSLLNQKRNGGVATIEIPNSDFDTKESIDIPKKKPRYSKVNYKTIKDLPIFSYRDKIIDAIKQNQVIVIAGKTGCGKTTQVPKMIYEDAMNNGKFDVKILITQPRRLAAVSIAKRLSYEMNQNLGDLVEYHVGMNPCFNSKTSQIIIKTTGIFLEELVHEKTNMNKYTHLIIDEVHERDISIDFALVLVKHFLCENTNIKLILMSATISPVLFANYFAASSIIHIREEQHIFEQENDCDYANQKDNDFPFEWASSAIIEEPKQMESIFPVHDAAPVIEIKEAVHVVYEFYLDDIIKGIKTTYEIFNKNSIQKKYYLKEHCFTFDKKVPSIEENMFYLCWHLIECIHSGGVNGNDNGKQSILVFLPGLGEIHAFETYLQDNFSQVDKIQILLLHSNVSDEEQQRVFETFKDKRKVILATNIAESSITIDDACYVIDFCLIKEIQYNCKTDHESLELRWASKANCYQRSGRAGRVSVGYVFRLVHENFFKNVLDNFPPPEILRIPLEKVILKIKVYEKEPKEILGRAIQPPKIKAIESAIMNLKNCGALTVDDTMSPSGQLTELGKVYAELPIDIRYSRLIMLSYTFGLTEIGIIASSILSQEKKLFKAYNNNRNNLYKSKLKFAMGTNCDIIASYNAFKVWQNLFKDISSRGRYWRRRKNEKRQELMKEWCVNNSINYRLLFDVQEYTNDIQKRLNKLRVYDYPSQKQREYGRYYYYNESNDKEALLKELEEKEKVALQELEFAQNPALIDVFKYVLAGAFYGRMFKSSYVDFDKIKKFREMSIKSKIDYANTIFVRGLPIDLDEKSLKQLFEKFGTIEYFEYQSQEARIGYTKDTCKEAIQLILFLGSNLVYNNQELAVEYTDKKNKQQRVYLRKPEYLYELGNYDLFSFSKVDIEADSINHVIIENNDEIIPRLVNICDNYYQRKTKFTARYVTRMPTKPMIDAILILIFTPSAQFIPNNDNNQYKSFKLLGTSNVEFVFKYLFSSIDIKQINIIRQALNQLVKTEDKLSINFETLKNTMITNLTNLVNKKRLKIISRDIWNKLLFKFFPNLKQEKEKNLRYSEGAQNEIKNEHKNIGASKISNDFLQPLQPLPIKEDFRLWTDEGLLKIEQERKFYIQMREKLVSNLSYRKSIINQTSAELYCNYCKTFICSLDNLKRYNNDKRYILSLWGKINEVDPNDEKVQKNPFVIEYMNNYSYIPQAFFTCFEGGHIIGYKVTDNYFLTPFSHVLIKIPGDEFVRWDDSVLNEDFKNVVKNGLKKRKEFILNSMECELCGFKAKCLCKDYCFCRKSEQVEDISDKERKECKCKIPLEKQYLEHLKNKEHLRSMKELQDEVF